MTPDHRSPTIRMGGLVMAWAVLAVPVACGGDDTQRSGETTADVVETSGDAPADALDDMGGDDGEAPDAVPADGTSEALAITTSSLPSGQAGTVYGPVALEARGGTPPYTWTLVEGVEPRPDFLDSGSGRLAGLIAVPGDYDLVVAVTDSAGARAERALTLAVAAPLSFDSASGGTIAGGEQWFGDFIVRAGDVVTLSADTTLEVTGALWIEPDARLEVEGCGALTIDHLSRTTVGGILGALDNACDDPAQTGGDLVVRTVTNLYLGGEPTDPRGLIASSGDVFMGDPWYRPRPEPEVLEYVATVEPGALPPACAVRADVLDAGEPPIYPVAVALEVLALDPDGGDTSVVRVDWGDTAIDEAPAALTHGYTAPGLHEVLVTVADDEGAECTATLTLHLAEVPSDDPEAPEAVASWRGPSSLWAAVEPFEAEALVAPVGVPFVLGSLRADADASAAWHIDGERVACPPADAACVAAAAVSSPGVHEITLTAESADGELTRAPHGLRAARGRPERARRPARAGAAVSAAPPPRGCRAKRTRCTRAL